VFREFTKKVSAKDMSMFDLDRTHKSDGAILPTGWNYALRRAGSQYIAFVRPLHEEQNKSAYPVNLLLFFALMRQESTCESVAVFCLNAAGVKF
jgi:hypothetical protein